MDGHHDNASSANIGGTPGFHGELMANAPQANESFQPPEYHRAQPLQQMLHTI
jgi:hypothetical protein